MFHDSSTRAQAQRPAARPYWDDRDDRDGRDERNGQAGAGADRPQVTIIGAGIIGLTSAAALLRAGCEVTVLDAGPAAASGASRGNGCQLSYGYVAPLAQPGLLAELPHLMLARGAPLQMRPGMDPARWRWMLEFLAACRAPVAQRSTAALLALGELSRQETERWIAGTDAAALSFGRHGKLVLLPSAASLASARRQMESQAGVGPEQRIVDEAEALALEPALVAFRGRIAGAVHTRSECVVDSLALCQDLERQLRQRGVTFEYGVQVTGFVRQRGRVSALKTSAGNRPVQQLLIANGSASAPLARQLGLRLPVVPLKGYSITVPVRRPAGAPTVSITDAAHKVVYARIGNRLRVAGMAELRGDDRRLDPRRIAQLVERTREAFGDAVDLDAAEPWTGMRPVTPTSVPMIGRAAQPSNVFFNVGQGALGLTLAFGSARRLADLMVAQD